MSNVLHLFEWLPIVLFSLMGSIFSIHITSKEIKRRKSTDVKFTTNSLRLFSLISMVTHVFYVALHIIEYFPIFCRFTSALIFIFLCLQFVFMGFFQLSRVYYCFSQSKVYSKKGYPTYIFIIMFTIGILLFLNVCIYPLVFTLWNTECGINSKYQFYPKQSLLLQNTENISIGIWVNVTVFIFIIWDLLTLLLYIIKVYSFRKYKSKDIKVYRRIMSILQRILILTVMYEIAASSTIIMTFVEAVITDQHMIKIVKVLNKLAFMITAGFGHYSMYLMQQHNDKQYYKFLKGLAFFKLHYIFCFCKYAINQVLELELEHNTVETIHMEQDKKKRNNNISSFQQNTADIPVQQSHDHIQELSAATISNLQK
eukprot:211179_1